MILLEGPDGGGKSTLGKVIGAATGMLIKHSGGPPKTASEARLRIQEQLSSHDLILDRSVCTSELVYGPVLRNEFIIPRFELWTGIETMIERGWLFIYCRPPLKLLRENFKEQQLKTCTEESKKWKDPLFVEEVFHHISDIAQCYDDLMDDIKDKGGRILFNSGRGKNWRSLL